jgi:topoisomerase-4 subunit A
LADILLELDKVEKSLKELNRYAIKYLTKLIKKYGAQYPRKTKISVFKEIKVRELTAKEHEICYDKTSGYIGYGVKGELVLHCSSYDKLIVVTDEGKYRMIAPPEKFYAGKTLHYCSRFDRDKVMTIIYTDGMFTYMKRFSFGGTILDREYNCAGTDATVHLYSDSDVDQVYVKYSPAKSQRIHQQLFSPSQVPVKGVKARGNQMTGKKIARMSATKPRWWDDESDHPKGVLI